MLANRLFAVTCTGLPWWRALVRAHRPHTVTLTIDPVVTFENGRATKAALRWSSVTGPTVVKSALWSATAVDNMFNVLQGTLVEKINEFLGPGCDEALGQQDTQ
jgi:hypothetical protein